jgi:alanine racemase
MGRIGVRNTEERDAVLAEIGKCPHVKLTGVFTHLSDADGDEKGMAYTEEQFRLFRRLTDELPGNVIRHCANSATIHRRPDMAMDMVRAGISLYGYPPVEDNIGLKPAMRWTAKISYIKELPAGAYISYGRTYRTDRATRVATVTCGYADGYHRAASGKAEVLIHGKRAPVLGRICMDQLMADISGIDDVKAEDEAVLMGTDGTESITAEDLAKWSGTISYEILVDAANRVERVFSSGKSEEDGKD